MGADKRLIGQSVKLSWLITEVQLHVFMYRKSRRFSLSQLQVWIEYTEMLVFLDWIEAAQWHDFEADRFVSGDASVSEKVRLGLGGDWKGNGDWRSWAWSELPKVTSDGNVWENLLIPVLFSGFWWSISSKLWNGKPSIPRTYLTHCKIIVAYRTSKS